MSETKPSTKPKLSPLQWLFLLRKVFLTSSQRAYWSQYGEEIGLDRVLDPKKTGFFVDVGCFHPTKYNNTYKFYRRGWRGINIDLDEIKIAAFNLRRPDDINLLACVSNEEATVDLCSSGTYSLTQTIDPETMEKMRKRNQKLEMRTVKTTPLTKIIDGTQFRDRKIDLLSVDVEGNEEKVLASLDFERYCPKIMILESHLRTLDEVIPSPLYQYAISKGYQLFNWTGPSLLFIHPRAR
ncbi:MAG TPA: FkbM family methyltransferase [Roseimicrobium sp.]|nr:FkbM family methyltransferase [Roseimicrobium sp.]